MYAVMNSSEHVSINNKEFIIYCPTHLQAAPAVNFWIDSKKKNLDVCFSSSNEELSLK